MGLAQIDLRWFSVSPNSVSDYNVIKKLNKKIHTNIQLNINPTRSQHNNIIFIFYKLETQYGRTNIFRSQYSLPPEGTPQSTNDVCLRR